MNKNKNIFLNGLIDLAQSRLGSKIVLMPCMKKEIQIQK